MPTPFTPLPTPNPRATGASAHNLAINQQQLSGQRRALKNIIWQGQFERGRERNLRQDQRQADRAGRRGFLESAFQGSEVDLSFQRSGDEVQAEASGTRPLASQPRVEPVQPRTSRERAASLFEQGAETGAAAATQAGTQVSQQYEGARRLVGVIDSLDFEQQNELYSAVRGGSLPVKIFDRTSGSMRALGEGASAERINEALRALPEMLEAGGYKKEDEEKILAFLNQGRPE